MKRGKELLWNVFCQLPLKPGVHRMNSMQMEKKTALLIVEDDLELRRQLRWALEDDFNVFEASSAEEALSVLMSEFIDIVTLDISLGTSQDDRSGMELLRHIQETYPEVKVIMVTGHSERELAIEAIGCGAIDYYEKPIDLPEFRIVLQRAAYVQSLEKENRRLARLLAEQSQLERIIGNSPQMLEVFDVIKKVAPTDATVLITGESGTGKELVARALHSLSPRQQGPFVAINCGAIPDTLLESELFGHEKGAFTGAHARKLGKFEIANGGTIFFDEIAELSPSLQVKILRFLESRSFERVGGNETIRVNVRFIAATNRKLEENIHDGSFREDLYYRLSVIQIHLPPLRDRGDDIVLLANHFLRLYNQQFKKRIWGFSDSCVQIMKRYRWPGNVRELENRVKRAVILSSNKYLSPEDMGFGSAQGTPKYDGGLRAALDEVEKRMVEHALSLYDGNISKASAFLKVSRAHLYDLLKKHGLERQNFRKGKFCETS